MVVVVLFNAGAQLPVMPFNDVVGNAVNVAPEQIAAIGLKVGVVDAPEMPMATPVVTIQPLASLM